MGIPASFRCENPAVAKAMEAAQIAAIFKRMRKAYRSSPWLRRSCRRLSMPWDNPLMIRTASWTAVLASFAFTAAAQPQAPRNGQRVHTLLIRHATVVDGNGTPARG